MTDHSPKPPLGLALRQAHLRAAQVFAEELRPLGMENVLAGILMQLTLRGPQTQRQLTDSLSSDKSAMVRHIDSLERQGLVLREPHPTDRRAHAVILTDAGRARLAETQAAAARTEQRLTGCFTPEERDLLHDLLIRFTRG
ncbi:MarR family winged helix-turn-helix transcriptional regulator [Kitasatospora sp. McL0602]|uniref:MarR family winged helix-turn-helix transcriptional regulator n=1 Tax=Kitasatospora sp. McL0602 TaxID=3439530 RepID=UPI003F89CE04